MTDALQQLLRPIRRRLDNVVARAVVRLVTDTTRLQGVQLAVLDGETHEGCERVQQYGFTSVPHVGAEAVVLFVGGFRDHPLVIAVDDRRSRKKDLQPGEAALYTDEGDAVHLRRGRIIAVTAGTKLLVTTPLVDCSQDVNAAGVYQVAGTQVVSSRGAAVANAIGTSAAEVAGVLNTLLARVRAHGLIAS